MSPECAVRVVEAPPDGAALLPDVVRALSGAGEPLAPIGSAATRAVVPTRLRGDWLDSADPVAAVLTTSGSTRAPRAVALTASALLASASATHDRLGGPGRWLLTLPLAHVAGLQVLVRSAVARTPVITLDLSQGFTPERFEQAAARVHALGEGRRYTALVPTQLVRLLDAGGAALEALSRFDAVLVGGAELGTTLGERARAAQVRVVTTYGSTETSGGCVYDGVPLDGVQVSLEPTSGVPGGADDVQGLAPTHGARIVVRGPVVARGYLDPDGELIEDPAFGADAHGRWFRSDDLGVRDDESRLRVLGRLDDAITTGGLTFSAAAIEDALMRLDAIEQAAVVGVPDAHWGQRIVAALVLRPGASEPSLEQVREHVGRSLERAAAPHELQVLSELPLRGPGKIDRRTLRERLTGS